MTTDGGIRYQGIEDRPGSADEVVGLWLVGSVERRFSMSETVWAEFDQQGAGPERLLQLAAEAFLRDPSSRFRGETQLGPHGFTRAELEPYKQ